jgi:hypothetical protein
MRTHLLQIAARFLVPLALAGCQEMTNPQGERIVDKAAGGPSMRSAVSDSAHRTTVSHFVAKGDFANVGWSGDSEGFLQIERASNLEGGIFLSYFVRQCVIVDDIPICTELAFGAGPIPAGDLTGDGRKGLKLSTNPSTNTNPDFFSFGPPGLSPCNGTQFLGSSLGSAATLTKGRQHLALTLMESPSACPPQRPAAWSDSRSPRGGPFATQFANMGTNQGVTVDHSFNR